MYALKNLMVGIDLTSMDEILMSHTAFMCRLLQPDKLSLVHVIPPEDLDSDELRHYQLQSHYKQEADKMLDKLLDEQADRFGSLRVDKIILQGNPLREMLRFAKNEQVDLAIVGEKNISRGAGIVSQRFARKAPCSTLFVTENARPQLKKVLLPTDFSDYSKMAFEEVRFLVDESPDIKILVQNIFRVPLGYYTTGKSFEEFAAIMEENHRREYEKFVKEINVEDLPLEPHFTLEVHHNEAQLINMLAEKENVDMVIIGAKGHTLASALLIGSTTEKLMKIDNKIPVLVLKKKGETLGFLETVLEI